MRFARFSAYVIGLAASALLAWGQSTASLSGTVTDPSGAVVPKAHVIVHSLATGIDRVVTTDADGLYIVPSLQPGDYRIQVIAAGFAHFVVPKVTFQVDQSVTQNVRLAVSAAGETVQVNDQTAQIEASSITVGQVIDNADVQQLPLNGRHFLDLTVLTPGSDVADTAAGSLVDTSRGLGANSFMTAGNREDSINFQINGINLNDISQNQITFQPSISTTGEFKVDNSSFSAEYGRSDGSIVTVATRSGTNQYHGEAFDYFRNDALDARNYFNRSYSPSTGITLPMGEGDKAPLIRNDFGGDGGGPLTKHHTFFYASYEGLRQHQGILQNSEVLTQTEQTTIAANKTAEPIAAAIAALLPLPNSGTTNFVGFTPGPVRIDQGTMDILQQLRANDSLHGFYALQEDTRTEPALQGDTIPGWGDHRHAVRQIATLSETHIFSPSLVNEARLGFNRINIAFDPANTTSPSSVGLGDGLTGNVGLPETYFLDIGLVFGGPSGFPQGRADTAGVVSDTLTKLIGKHTIKMGGEFRRYGLDSFGGNIGTLEFSTSTTPTSLFQMDEATIFSVQPNIVSSRVYANAIGAFVQDNYKLTPTLTLEGGLRFEWNGTPVEADNRFTLFNPGALTLTQVGTNGLSRTATYNQNNNIEPRVGFAYDIFGTGKTVLRGGYAFLVDQPVAGVVTGLASNPPFSTAVSYSNSLAPIPLSSLYASAKLSGVAIYYVDPKYRNADIQSFNLNLQQAMPWGLIGSLYYVGSLGRHLEIDYNLNQETGPQGTNPATNTAYPTGRPYTALSATSPEDPGGSINSNIGWRRGEGLSDYNAMWAVLQKNMSSGLQFNMSYEWTKSMDENSLGSQGGLVLPDSTDPKENYGLSDFDVRQHYAGTAIYSLPFHGNRLTSGYQLSTIFQYQTGNPVNIVASSSGFNGNTGLIRPSIVGKIVRQKQQMAGLTNLTYFQNPGGETYGGDVCDVTNFTSACVYEIQAGQYNSAGTPLSTSATSPTVYTGLGTAQRNAATGPGYADMDLSGEKDTKIHERLTFNLRVDAFDVLNHPNFYQPSGNVQSSTFGQITQTRFPESDGGSSRQLQISGKFTF